MRVKAVSLDGKKTLEFESTAITPGFLESMVSFELTEEDVRKRIERLEVSADVKSLLFAMTKASVTIGRQVVRVGRKIIDYICGLLKEYPKMTFFALLGAVAGLLVATIPLIGFILAPLLTPIAIAVGAAFGALEDLRDQALKRKIAEFQAKFAPLGAQS